MASGGNHGPVGVKRLLIALIIWMAGSIIVGIVIGKMIKSADRDADVLRSLLEMKHAKQECSHPTPEHLGHLEPERDTYAKTANCR